MIKEIDMDRVPHHGGVTYVKYHADGTEGYRIEGVYPDNDHGYGESNPEDQCHCWYLIYSWKQSGPFASFEEAQKYHDQYMMECSY